MWVAILEYKLEVDFVGSTFCQIFRSQNFHPRVFLKFRGFPKEYFSCGPTNEKNQMRTYYAPCVASESKATQTFTFELQKGVVKPITGSGSLSASYCSSLSHLALQASALATRTPVNRHYWRQRFGTRRDHVLKKQVFRGLHVG